MPQVVAAAAVVSATTVATVGGVAITVGTLAKGALLLGGIARGIRDARRARQMANASLQDRTTPVRASDMARSIVYGRTRVADILAYHVTHGNRSDVVSHLVTLAGHEIAGVDEVRFGDKWIGPLDGDGNVQSDSYFFASRPESLTREFVGSGAGGTHTLDLAGRTLLGLDTLVYITAPQQQPSIGGDADIDVLPGETVELTLGVDYTLAGNVITLITAAAFNRPLIATYRVESGTPYARVFVFRGIQAGERDLNLESWSGGEWPSTAIGRNVPRLHVVTFWEETIYATGFPQVSAIIRGKLVYDPRLDSTNGGTGSQRANDQTTWAYSDNPALCAADYLRDRRLGFGCASTEIDWPSVIEAANVCDELVPLASGSQRRYVCAGVLSTEATRQSNLEEILDSMVGTAFFSAGRWTLRAGAYRMPTLDLADTDLVGPLRWKARAPRRELFNAVRGRYRSPAEQYQVIDYPAYVSPTYVGEDGGETIYRQIDMPMVDDAVRAQRIAKLVLFRARQALTIEASFRMSAYAVQPGDTVRLTHPAYGWTNKVFRVTRRRLVELSVVTVELQEEASAVYAWDFNEATTPDPAPNSNLPDPRFVQQPTDVSVVANRDTYYVRQDGAVVPYVRVSWAQLTQDDARVEVYWKRADENEYTRISTAIGAAETRIEGIARGDVLNLYLVAVNSIGARSAVVWFPRYVIGDVVAGEQSRGTNLVRNAGVELGVAHWGPYEAGLIAIEGVEVRRATPGYVIPGSPSSLLVHIRSNRTGSGIAGGTRAARVRVTRAGQPYVGYASLIGWGTDARCRLEFYNSIGSRILRVDGGNVAGVPVESALRRMDNPAHYELSVVRAVAPPDAAFVDLILAGTGNWLAGPDKYVSGHRPLLAEDIAGSLVLPTWSPGPRNMVDTPDVLPDALVRVYVDRVTSPRVIPALAGQFGYIAQAPNIVMPPHSPEFADGMRVVIRASLNLQAVVGGASLTRDELTVRLGVLIGELDPTGTQLLGGGVPAAPLLWQHYFTPAIDTSTIAGRRYEGTASYEDVRPYRSDRRYLIGMVLADPVSGNPPSGWTYTALPGSHVTVEIHKTERVV